MTQNKLIERAAIAPEKLEEIEEFTSDLFAINSAPLKHQAGN